MSVLLLWAVQLNNRWDVPYNPFLLLQFNAHINVEICCTVSAVKYISLWRYVKVIPLTINMHHWKCLSTPWKWLNSVTSYWRKGKHGARGWDSNDSHQPEICSSWEWHFWLSKRCLWGLCERLTWPEVHVSPHHHDSQEWDMRCNKCLRNATDTWWCGCVGECWFVWGFSGSHVPNWIFKFIEFKRHAPSLTDPETVRIYHTLV